MSEVVLTAGRRTLRRASRSARPEKIESGQANLFRGGLVFKAHRLLYHSTVGLRVIKKKKAHTEEGVPLSKRVFVWTGAPDMSQIHSYIPNSAMSQIHSPAMSQIPLNEGEGEPAGGLPAQRARVHSRPPPPYLSL